MCPRPWVLPIVTSSKSLGRKHANVDGEFDYLGQRVAGLSRLNLNKPFDDDAHGLNGKKTLEREFSIKIAGIIDDIAFLSPNGRGTSIQVRTNLYRKLIPYVFK